MFKDNCFFEGIKLYIQEQSAGLQQQNPEFQHQTPVCGYIQATRAFW